MFEFILKKKPVFYFSGLPNYVVGIWFNTQNVFFLMLTQWYDEIYYIPLIAQQIFKRFFFQMMKNSDELFERYFF